MGLSSTPKIEEMLTEKNQTTINNETFRIFASCPEEEIVISGMAGRYPSCDNVEELRHNLYNEVCYSNEMFLKITSLFEINCLK